MNAAAPSITKHEPSHPDYAACTTSLNIDHVAKSLQAKRVRVADFFYPRDKNVDPTPYFPAINSCVYDLFKDHRGTVSAKAWIIS